MSLEQNEQSPEQQVLSSDYPERSPEQGEQPSTQQAQPSEQHRHHSDQEDQSPEQTIEQTPEQLQPRAQAQPPQHCCSHCRRPYVLDTAYLTQLHTERLTLRERQEEENLPLREEEILRNIETILAREERPRPRNLMEQAGLNHATWVYVDELEFLAGVDEVDFPVLYGRLGNERRRYAQYLGLFRPSSQISRRRGKGSDPTRPCGCVWRFE
jgi:hypothetical protein